ncbi:hypothetical protein LUQ84_002644 [Hamiltosporidium tvaerminnensis]|nr:hypothetical protein LUQ84_002644 [Hamiltosporidium tvaerminnensis]
MIKEKEVEKSFQFIKDNLNCCFSLEKLNIKEIKGIFILGGDGTVLKILQKLNMSEIPNIYAVNHGFKGFLCPIKPSEVEKMVLKINKNENEIKFLKRKRLFLKDGGYFLNDVIISRKACGKLNKFKIFIDNKFICEIRCDSVIIATPTGSSGYNLSAGGSIVSNDCNVMIITFVCPPDTKIKSIVVPITSKIRVKLQKIPDAESDCIIDGGNEIVGKEEYEITNDNSFVRFAYLDENQSFLTELFK